MTNLIWHWRYAKVAEEFSISFLYVLNLVALQRSYLFFL